MGLKNKIPPQRGYHLNLRPSFNRPLISSPFLFYTATFTSLVIFSPSFSLWRFPPIHIYILPSFFLLLLFLVPSNSPTSLPYCPSISLAIQVPVCLVLLPFSQLACPINLRLYLHIIIQLRSLLVPLTLPLVIPVRTLLLVICLTLKLIVEPPNILIIRMSVLQTTI